ncbi:hypothetical protein [Cytobacillus horneckiae]|uniref:hypothetical protein n=1 Tax=Cytobacillus horneckiae TaxID=549687 RepID=UPI003D1CD44F
MFKDEILTFQLIKYNPKAHEFIALYEGKEVLVDPFVGDVWSDDKRVLGLYTFEGIWNQGCFLPSKEIQ